MNRIVRLAVVLLCGGLSLAGNDAVLAAADAQYAVVVNIDGLNAKAIPILGSARVPNLWRMRTEGAFTDNARTDYARTVTAPNHTTILTGRPVISPNGHLWGSNDPDPLSLAPSLHVAHNFPNSPIKPAYEYVYSVYDVVHDRGLRTALCHQKGRMALIQASYDAVNGAPDIIGADNGRNKIDRVVTIWGSGLVSAWINDMRANPFAFSYLLFAATDSAGHNSGFDLTIGSPYMNAVQLSDQWLGQIFALIESDARLAGKTTVIVTADHGGTPGTTGHTDVTNPNNYTVPFYVWGPSVAPGADLYALNPQYTNPGTSRPTNEAPNQPIRNGYTTNLALSELGLPAIPNSGLNADQRMKVRSGTTAISPCGEPTFNPAVDAAIVIWKNCSTDGSWHVRAGAGGGYVNYIGSIVGDRTFDYVLPVSLESSDTLDTSSVSSVGFNLRMTKSYDDGFDFSAPADANLCLNVTAPVPATILVGAGRTPIHTPINLKTMSRCGTPAIDANGAPAYDPALDSAIFLWRESDGSWRLRGAAGGGTARYVGAINANQPFNSVSLYSIETSDTVNTSNPAAIGFDLRMHTPWQDGINFAMPSGATSCFTLSAPAATPVLVGPNRTPVTPPFNLSNFGAC